MPTMTSYDRLDAWIDAHFDEEIRFLQSLVRIPTDTPPGDNAPHAERTAALLGGFGFAVERHPVPAAEVRAYGLESLTNLIVRRPYADGGPTIALNAHGDVVPPGEGWTHDPYGAEIEDGRLYGRASAVSKSDFATYTFAVRALEALATPLKGGVELHFTYDEEFGGELGPGWLLKHGLTRPDLLLAAGFSYQVVTAHNGCLQMEVTVHGKMAHAAIPHTGVDALQGAVAILNALYAQNLEYRKVTSGVSGITHPYLNVGRIEGGTNTNVVPGRVVLRLDRRMIPEERPAEVEAAIRQVIAEAAEAFNADRAGAGVGADEPLARAGRGANDLSADTDRAALDPGRLDEGGAVDDLPPTDAASALESRSAGGSDLTNPTGIRVEIRRLLLANALRPLPGNRALVEALQRHGEAVFGLSVSTSGTPLYTDVRLYGEAGIPAAIYGAGPRTVFESNAKRADEHLVLEDLRKATKVVARTLYDLLGA